MEVAADLVLVLFLQWPGQGWPVPPKSCLRAAPVPMTSDQMMLPLTQKKPLPQMLVMVSFMGMAFSWAADVFARLEQVVFARVLFSTNKEQANWATA